MDLIRFGLGFLQTCCASAEIVVSVCVHRVLVEQLTADKHQLNTAYNNAVAALRQMLADSREMHALLMHTNTYVLSFIDEIVFLPGFV